MNSDDDEYRWEGSAERSISPSISEMTQEPDEVPLLSTYNPALELRSPPTYQDDSGLPTSSRTITYRDAFNVLRVRDGVQPNTAYDATPTISKHPASEPQRSPSPLSHEEQEQEQGQEPNIPPMTMSTPEDLKKDCIACFTYLSTLFSGLDMGVKSFQAGSAFANALVYYGTGKFLDGSFLFDMLDLMEKANVGPEFYVAWVENKDGIRVIDHWIEISYDGKYSRPWMCALLALIDPIPFKEYHLGQHPQMREKIHTLANSLRFGDDAKPQMEQLSRRFKVLRGFPANTPFRAHVVNHGSSDRQQKKAAKRVAKFGGHSPAVAASTS